MESGYVGDAKYVSHVLDVIGNCYKTFLKYTCAVLRVENDFEQTDSIKNILSHVRK